MVGNRLGASDVIALSLYPPRAKALIASLMVPLSLMLYGGMQAFIRSSSICFRRSF